MPHAPRADSNELAHDLVTAAARLTRWFMVCGLVQAWYVPRGSSRSLLRLVSAEARLTRWFSSSFVCAAWLLAQISRSMRTLVWQYENERARVYLYSVYLLQGLGFRV